jgi:hypothetical protein
LIYKDNVSTSGPGHASHERQKRRRAADFAAFFTQR